MTLGVVDAVSEGKATAYETALELATEINQSGKYLAEIPCFFSSHPHSTSTAPLALRAAKLAISKAPELDLDSGLSFERACYEPLLSTSDRTEALDAFREKRKPVFKGE